MLLPSDVARLVLGYLQEEGLSSTSQSFIHESPNLKEYAEHSTEDGAIPACVFSLFGKSLTTILNEYVAAKTKETNHEVPVIMTSLWKKLDFTLNQIKSLQNSPGVLASQRMRSRVGVANIRHQRTLTLSPTGSVLCSSASEAGPIVSPMHTSHNMLGHSTPVSSTHFQVQEGGPLVSMSRDLPVHILVPEHRLTSGPMSPGRRKWDSPRRRGSGLSGAGGTGRSTMTVSSLAAEPQPEEVVDENFPQLVIQNAREKILGDRLLQEKLAENINKILASDPTPPTSKASCSSVEPDQSIDEILGLQGEIHMSDDAIHDILEQTESDPAFQALFDLFDYNRTRINEIEPGGGDIGSIPEESDVAVPLSIDKPLQNEDPGSTLRDVTSAQDATPVKERTGQEPKTRTTRKSAAPSSSKKTVLGPSGRRSRIENSTARLLISHEKQPEISTAAEVDSNRVEKGSPFNVSDVAAPMDVDEPLNTLPPFPHSDSTASRGVFKPARMDSATTSTALSALTTILSTSSSPGSAALETASASNVTQIQEDKRAPGAAEKTNAQAENKSQSASDPPPVSSSPSSFASRVPDESSKTPVQTANLPHVKTAVPSSLGNPQLTDAPSVTSAQSVSSTSASAPAPVMATPNPPTVNPDTQSKGAVDPSNIVSLKIIISDEQDEPSSSDKVLNQAISSISGDKIPTIFLSSPAKSPAKAPGGLPGTPQLNQDEIARAVNSLQSSEVIQPTASEANPLSGKAGMVVTSSLAGTSSAQPSYIIQLPLDTTNPGLPGATANYFLVSDPSTTDPQARQVLVPAGISQGQPMPPSQYALATPPRSQGYPTGSTLILQSPVQPMMLPVSVMGQNTVGKFQMVSNQLVAIQRPLPMQQTETVKPKSTTVALKQSTVSRTTEQNLANKVAQPMSSENPSLQKAPAGSSPSHRRILRFESSEEARPPHTTKTTATTTPPAANAPVSLPVQPPKGDDPQLLPRTKPAILGGNKPKRRIEIVRCTDNAEVGSGLAKEAEKPLPPQQQQKEILRKTPRKQDHKIQNEISDCENDSRVDTSQPESLKKSESGRRSKSTERKHNNNNDDDDGDQAKTKDSNSSRSLSSDPTLKSGSRKEKEEGSRKEPAEKAPVKCREGRPEKRTSSQESPNVTANKENEVEGNRREQQQPASSSAPRAFSPPPVSPPTPNPQSKSVKTPSKTSSLAKQAAEMLQDIQGLNPPSTPAKRPGVGSSDLPRTPRPGRNQEDSIDCPRTPARQRQVRDGEGTPRHLIPPTTPELPTCSPASEAGSENSINMAAHTLMILSRAAIARTGTPLKDSLRQEGVGEKSPTTSKHSKKRKQPATPSSPPAKKELKHSSSSKKKEKKQKQLLDCFPDDLDVDKFLSSLHYDE
ncbi:protein NPAT [Polymixia lowei]